MEPTDKKEAANEGPETRLPATALTDDLKTASTDMEVHHHTHHDHSKRNWRSYFWEFLMLFLAVFCGFLAEYQLEQTIERHREKEFIESMIQDAATDTANIHAAIKENRTRIQHADSLVHTSLHYQGTQAENTRLYKAVRGTIYYPDLVYPTDRTLFQLKNAGGMRLIQKKKAAESIIAYDNSGKKVVNQQGYYEHYLTALTTATAATMNFADLLVYNQPYSDQLYQSVTLVNPTTEKMLQIGNNAKMFQGVMMQYIVRLEEMEKEAVVLMTILRNEYAIQ